MQAAFFLLFTWHFQPPILCALIKKLVFLSTYLSHNRQLVVSISSSLLTHLSLSKRIFVVHDVDHIYPSF